MGIASAVAETLPAKSAATRVSDVARLRASPSSVSRGQVVSNKMS